MAAELSVLPPTKSKDDLAQSTFEISEIIIYFQVTMTAASPDSDSM